MSKFEFVNHSCIILSHNNISLAMDPWIEGSVFNNSWDLLSKTPEKSIDIQRDLGADLIFVLDECTPYNVDKNYTEKSMHMTHRWAKRCIQNFKTDNKNYMAQNGSAGLQQLYGIVQGGVYSDLRRQACEEICSMDFDGLAIGGSLGGTKDQMYEVFEFCSSFIDPSKPISTNKQKHAG